jgi:hypothetical protein
MGDQVHAIGARLQQLQLSGEQLWTGHAQRRDLTVRTYVDPQFGAGSRLIGFDSQVHGCPLQGPQVAGRLGNRFSWRPQ